MRLGRRPLTDNPISLDGIYRLFRYMGSPRREHQGLISEYIVTCCDRLILDKISHICFFVRCAVHLLFDTARAFKTIRPDL
jgi:hypothetical protein